MIERTIDGSSVALQLFLKAKPAGRVPPDAILLSGNKSMQKCLILAEGISSARFLRHPITTEHNKPARYRGPSLQCDLQGKSKKTSQALQPSTAGEALKSLGSCEGNVDMWPMRIIRIDVAALTSQTCPAQRRPFSAYSFGPAKE